MDYRLGLIRARPTSVSLSRLKIRHSGRPAEGHPGAERHRVGPDRARLTSALPQHPIAVRVDAPGASRSFTELHGASTQWQQESWSSTGGLRTRAAPCGPGGRVPTVRLSAPTRSSGLLNRTGINSRGFVRHTSRWAVRYSGHSSHYACAHSGKAYWSRTTDRAAPAVPAVTTEWKLLKEGGAVSPELHQNVY